jgi:hypothetical protein
VVVVKAARICWSQAADWATHTHDSSEAPYVKDRQWEQQQYLLDFWDDIAVQKGINTSFCPAWGND